MPVSLFVDNDDTFDVDFYVASSKEKPSLVYCDIDPEELKKVAGDDLVEGSLTKETVTFRAPNYEDTSRILDASVKLDPQADGAVQINLSALRYERIALLAVAWTLKDAEGNATKPTRSSLRRLHATVAMVLAAKLEEALQARGQL